MSAPVALASLRAFAAGSTRPPGKCLGFVGNDVTGHFGTYPSGATAPWSAGAAADGLQRIGLLNTTPCPPDSHFDFYDFVENGIAYGHIDLHVPADGGNHYADSGRCTTYLNPGRTVGTYTNWGGPRRGWSYAPAVGASLGTIVVPAPAPNPTPPAWQNVLPDVPTGQRIQRGLAQRHRYAGPIDGVLGPNGWRGIQQSAALAGAGFSPYTGPVDGIPGPNTIKGVQGYAKHWGGYTGPIDGVAGPNTWGGFARALGQ